MAIDDIITKQIQQLDEFADLPADAALAIQGVAGPAGRFPVDSVLQILRDELADNTPGKGAWLVAWIRNATGAVARWVSDKLHETWSFEDFGAVGDGVVNSDGSISGTDDTDAITKAITAANTSGARIRMLDKKYRVTAKIPVPNSATILGCGANAETALPANVGWRKPKSGSWFLHDTTTEQLLYCRDDASVGESKNFCRFGGFGIYQDQGVPGVGWTPTVHLEAIRVEARVDIDDILFLNTYVAAKVRSNGVLTIGKVRGQPLYRGVDVERSSDIQNWGTLHWWPFWSQESIVVNDTLVNASAVYVTRADGLRIDRMFSYGYKWTLEHVDASGAGSGMAGYHINALYCDKTGGGIRFNSNYYSPYGTIGAVLVNSDSAVGGVGAAIEVSGAVAGHHRINGLDVTRSHEEAVIASGAAHVVDVAPGKIADWDRLSASHYAFKADDGAQINLLTAPVLSGGNGLIYNQGTSGGIINYSVRYQIGKPIIGPTGFYSERVNIADDGVAIIPVPSTDKTVNLHIIPASVPSAGNPAGWVWLRASASPSVGPNTGLSHTANVDLGTGALTGTTGTDGNLRINSHTDGNIYIENRTGASRVFILAMLGN